MKTQKTPEQQLWEAGYHLLPLPGANLYIAPSGEGRALTREQAFQQLAESVDLDEDEEREA